MHLLMYSLLHALTCMVNISSHRVLTEAEQRAFEEEAPRVIQTYTKPREEDLAPASGDSIKILETPFACCILFSIEFIVIK